MGKVSASVNVKASLAEVWDFYFEPKGWRNWVDGFASVETADGGYPEDGGRLVWRSTPAGRGTVTETVLEHAPRRVHRWSYEDKSSVGEGQASFEIDGEEVKVTQELEYKMREHGAFGPLTDRLFVRRPVRRSIEASLTRLKHEVGEIVALTGNGGSEGAPPSRSL